jgi:IS5 family transposase
MPCRAMDAALHDSQAVDELLTRGNTGFGVWADAAYRSAEIETELKATGLSSHIHRKGKRGKPLTEQVKASNRTKSSVRVGAYPLVEQSQIGTSMAAI